MVDLVHFTSWHSYRSFTGISLSMTQLDCYTSSFKGLCVLRSSWSALWGVCVWTQRPIVLGHLSVGAAGLWAELTQLDMSLPRLVLFLLLWSFPPLCSSTMPSFQSHGCYPLARQNICWIQPRGILISRYNNILSFTKGSIIS